MSFDRCLKMNAPFMTIVKKIWGSRTDYMKLVNAMNFLADCMDMDIVKVSSKNLKAVTPVPTPMQKDFQNMLTCMQSDSDPHTAKTAPSSDCGMATNAPEVGVYNPFKKQKKASSL